MPGRPPDYDVCIVQEYTVGSLGGGGSVAKANWYKVGVAWRNEKSGSISLTMANLPGVKIVLVKPKPKGAGTAGGAMAGSATGKDVEDEFGTPQYEGGSGGRGRDPF
jgi:hypothetical protein